MTQYDDLIGEPQKPPRLLNAAQARFVEEFLATGNKTQAALAAGYTDKAPSEAGYDVANKPYVAEAIAEGRERMFANLLITPQRIMAEYRKIAFCDVRKLTDDNGVPIPIHQIDDETAGALAGLDMTSTDVGGNVTSKTIRYKLSDKKAALDALAKHMNLTPADRMDVNVDGKLEVVKSRNDVARRIAFILTQAALPTEK